MTRTRLLPLGAALLLGLAAAGCAPVSDLIVKDLSLDPQNRLTVTFKNEGKGEVPANKGVLSIHIDGRSVGGYALGNLADQSFRTPGGSVTIPTNFRIAGANRRISAFVDSQREIVEANEFQNTVSGTFTPPGLSGPDFIVSDLSLTSADHLRIQVRNIGTAASPASFGVRIRVIVNNSVAADLTPSLPALAAGSKTRDDTLRKSRPV